MNKEQSFKRTSVLCISILLVCNRNAMAHNKMTPPDDALGSDYLSEKDKLSPL